MSKCHTTEFCENCYKEWCCTNECKYHLLHRVKQARDKIESKIHKDPYLNFSRRNRDRNDAFLEVLDILDKLIKEGEE